MRKCEICCLEHDLGGSRSACVNALRAENKRLREQCGAEEKESLGIECAPGWTAIRQLQERVEDLEGATGKAGIGGGLEWLLKRVEELERLHPTVPPSGFNPRVG